MTKVEVVVLDNAVNTGWNVGDHIDMYEGEKLDRWLAQGIVKRVERNIEETLADKVDALTSEKEALLKELEHLKMLSVGKKVVEKPLKKGV